MSYKILCLLLCLFFHVIGQNYAQNSKTDSLENLLKLYTTDDTVKINLLCEIANSLIFNDLDKSGSIAQQALDLSEKLNFTKGKAESTWLIGISYTRIDKLKALDYIQQALKIAKSIDYKTGIAKCLNSSGIIFRSQGNISKAIACYQSALIIAEEIKDKELIVKSLINMSVLYNGEGNYEKAKEGYEKALKLLDEQNDPYLRTVCYHNIGSIFKLQGNYVLALDYQQKSLKIAEDQNDKIGILNCLIDISAIFLAQSNYNSALTTIQKALKIAEALNIEKKIMLCLESTGNIYIQTKDAQALFFFNKALTIALKLNEKLEILQIQVKIGDFYLQQKNYSKAFDNYQDALKFAETTNSKRVVCDIWYKIGTIYLRQKNYKNALDFTLNSLEIANNLKLLINQKDIHYQLSEIYSSMNNYKNAYMHYVLFKNLSDSIFNEKEVQKLAELEMNFMFDKEKQRIEQENQQKILKHEAKDKIQRIFNISLIVCFLLLLFLAIFLYRSNRFKHKTNIILTKQKLEFQELNEEYQVVNEELKQSNEQLYLTKKLVEGSEEKLRLMIKNSNDIFVLVNEKGEQFFISDAAIKLTGYTIEELTGMVDDVIYPEDREIVQHHIKRVMTDKSASNCIQYRHKHKEKGYVWFETVAQNFLDHPAIKSIVANVRDITERKNVEQELKESEEVKAKLMAMELDRINSELESNQKSITAATLKLVQNSERDFQTIDRLEGIEKNTNSEGKQQIKTLISDYKRISYNSNWDEFEILFEKVHRSFYERLNLKYATLTANERKICAFLKLNMSSKDIAQITFQSEDALKKARLRLRQKLGIDRETNLVTFIQNI